MPDPSPAPLTPEELRELQRLEKAATPGLWESGGLDVESRNGLAAICPVPMKGGTFACRDNAAFIAALRTAAPRLFSELAALREENERQRARLASIEVGDLDPFNRPASRIHRALSFAREHGYHETDDAFAELHSLRAKGDHG